MRAAAHRATRAQITARCISLQVPHEHCINCSRIPHEAKGVYTDGLRIFRVSASDLSIIHTVASTPQIHGSQAECEQQDA
jgi:hypothetical protein